MIRYRHLNDLIDAIRRNHPKVKNSNPYDITSMLVTSYEVNGKTTKTDGKLVCLEMIEDITEHALKLYKAHLGLNKQQVCWSSKYVLTFDKYFNVAIHHTPTKGFFIDSIYCDYDLMIALEKFGKGFFETWRNFEFACFEACDLKPEKTQSHKDIEFERAEAVKDIHPKLMLA